jgi:hypothetical protein
MKNEYKKSYEWKQEEFPPGMVGMLTAKQQRKKYETLQPVF